MSSSPPTRKSGPPPPPGPPPDGLGIPEPGSRPTRIGGTVEHVETDEISCSCGFVAEAEDYDKARGELRQHLADNPFEFPVQRRVRELEAEIERLRASLRNITNTADPGHARELARAALSEGSQ